MELGGVVGATLGGLLVKPMRDVRGVPVSMVISLV